ncbi:hypothetical protein EJB05_17997, partial [Eragrostis curvula]
MKITVDYHAESLDLERRLLEAREKLDRVQATGVAAALGSWDGSLEGIGEEELRELLASIDVSLEAAAARSRDQERQPRSGGAADSARILPGPARADVVTAETSGPVRARGARKAAPRRRPRRGKADAGGGVPGLPRGENPKPPNAAPLVADQVAAALGASGVPRRLCDVDAGGGVLEENPGAGAPNAAPLVADDAAAGDDVQILQPPDAAAAADDDDDAKWMRDLVEALKENPTPSNAAPYCSETEYLYMGGSVMERDAHDFIRFDLGMPPPCIGPDSPEPDDGEPLNLWPWE